MGLTAMNRHPHPFLALFTALSGVGTTIETWLTNGSLLITCLGGIMSLFGGYWWSRASRAKARMNEAELAMKQIELAKMQKST